MLIEHWLWSGTSTAARIARLALLPPSILYAGATAARTAAYNRRLLRSEHVSVPTVAVGNLSVGGTGKTPLTAWIADYYERRGIRPGILLRGFGDDEAAVHRRLVPGAIVVENPARVAGAEEAVSKGAAVVILDDAFQRHDIQRDLNIAVLSVESAAAPRLPLPAGPWRESWSALHRADLIVITRKRGSVEEAARLERSLNGVLEDCTVTVANLRIRDFCGLSSGMRLEASAISGTEVVVAAGVGDPDSFANQCRALNARVRMVRWRDHKRLTDCDLLALAELGSEADRVIVTEKDAVKLRGRWPVGYQEPIVANLQVVWERGMERVSSALDAAVNTPILRPEVE